MSQLDERFKTLATGGRGLIHKLKSNLKVDEPKTSKILSTEKSLKKRDTIDELIEFKEKAITTKENQYYLDVFDRLLKEKV